MNGDDDVFIDTVELPFAKRSVCFAEAYHGYDYTLSGIISIYSESGLFSCNSALKKSNFWGKFEKLYEEIQMNIIWMRFILLAKTSLERILFMEIALKENSM